MTSSADGAMHVSNMLISSGGFIEREGISGLTAQRHQNYFHNTTTNPTAVCSGETSQYFLKQDRMAMNNQPSL